MKRKKNNEEIGKGTGKKGEKTEEEMKGGKEGEGKTAKNKRKFCKMEHSRQAFVN